jgi:hypothetical protein
VNIGKVRLPNFEFEIEGSRERRHNDDDPWPMTKSTSIRPAVISHNFIRNLLRPKEAENTTNNHNKRAKYEPKRPVEGKKKIMVNTGVCNFVSYVSGDGYLGKY